jgi:tellurite resistance protein
MMLSALAVRKLALSASIAYVLAPYLPGAQRSVVQQRVPQEFEQLFRTRFYGEFPNGFAVAPSAKNKPYLYRPASAALRPFIITLPDPLGAPSRYKALAEIWNSCVTDLRKIGNAANKGVDAGSVSRWEALPSELRAGQDHPLTDAICKIIEQKTDESGHIYLQASDLAKALALSTSGTITLVQSRRLAQTVEDIGYCIEPDARLVGRGYRADETVTLFLKMNSEAIDIGRYNAAACILQFGYLVAAVDGHADDCEMSLVRSQIDAAFALQEDETRRLQARTRLLAKTGPDRPLIRRLAKALKKEQREAIGRLLVAVVAADGVVTTDERKALRSACGLLELNFTELEKSLPSERADDSPVTVVGATSGAPGQVIPSRPQEDSLVLNRDAIAAILRDTQDVAAMLVQAMAAEEEAGFSAIEKAIDPVPAAPQVDSATADCTAETADAPKQLPQPPARYAAFYAELVARRTWIVADADAAARRHGVMLSGALDALNEWAAEELGGQVFIEEGDQLVVEQTLLT